MTSGPQRDLNISIIHATLLIEGLNCVHGSTEIRRLGLSGYKQSYIWPSGLLEVLTWKLKDGGRCRQNRAAAGSTLYVAVVRSTFVPPLLHPQVSLDVWPCPSHGAASELGPNSPLTTSVRQGLSPKHAILVLYIYLYTRQVNKPGLLKEGSKRPKSPKCLAQCVDFWHFQVVGRHLQY